jgi:acyl carrier protein
LPEKSRLYNIKEIENHCSNQETSLPTNHRKPREGLTKFGPRWHNNLKKIKIGENQGIAYIGLPEEFAGDMTAYQLHPALLDTAIASSTSKDEDLFLPFSFKRIVIKSPLPRKLISHIKYSGNNENKKEFLNKNITIMDDQGNELIQIEDYTLIAVSRDKISNIEQGGDSLHYPAELGLPREAIKDIDQSQIQKDLLKYGILPTEGVEVFKRILGYTTPQVVVSTVDLTTRFESLHSFGRLPSTGLPEEGRHSASTQSRPELSIPYIAPKNEMEKLLVEIWQNYLGIKQVGINDNFFELGATSLSIIQVNGIIKETIKKDIPVVTMYKYPTVRELAQYLIQEDGGEALLHEELNQLQTVYEGKNKLRQRKQRVNGGEYDY